MNDKPTSFSELGLLAAGLLLAYSSPVSAQSYTFTDLWPGTSGRTMTFATAINASGQVVGSAFDVGYANWHAMLWSGGMATDLGTLGGSSSQANAINVSGQVAGYADLVGDAAAHATIWNGTSASDLGAGATGGIAGTLSGINASGQTVGWAFKADGTAAHANRWNGATATDLGTLGGSWSQAMAINASGQVAGYANLTGDAAARAIIWNGTAVTELDTLGGAYSVAYGINDAGQAVGWSTIVGGAQHATLWNGTIATDLGTLGGYANSMGSAINGTGQVAGYSYTSDYRTYRATLWNGSTATDLNTLLDASSVDAGWVLTRANGINDSGSIVGEAVNTKSGVMHGFVLVSAVPEPETYGMLLAGLVLMGAVARRRKCVEAATDSFMEA